MKIHAIQTGRVQIKQAQIEGRGPSGSWLYFSKCCLQEVPTSQRSSGRAYTIASTTGAAKAPLPHELQAVRRRQPIRLNLKIGRELADECRRDSHLALRDNP